MIPLWRVVWNAVVFLITAWLMAFVWLNVRNQTLLLLP